VTWTLSEEGGAHYFPQSRGVALGRREDLPFCQWLLIGNSEIRHLSVKNVVFGTQQASSEQILFIILGVALLSTKVAALSSIDQEGNFMMLS
jgi:hypothetical protein